MVSMAAYAALRPMSSNETALQRLSSSDRYGRPDIPGLFSPHWREIGFVENRGTRMPYSGISRDFPRNSGTQMRVKIVIFIKSRPKARNSEPQFRYIQNLPLDEAYNAS